MKQKTLIHLLIVGLAVLFWPALDSAAPVNEHHKKVVVQLMDFLNSRMEGNRFELNPDDTIVTPVDNDRYRIILKDVVYITDLTRAAGIMTNYFSPGDFNILNMGSGRMKEMSMIYNTKNNHIQMQHIKDLNVENEIPDDNSPSPLGGWKMHRVRASMGKITYLPPKNPDKSSQENTLEHLKLEVTGLNPKKEKVTLLLDISKIGKVDVGEEDGLFSGSLADKDAALPDLQTALKKGKAISDLTIHLGKIDILLTKNGKEICHGNIKNAIFSQFMRPEKSRKSFEKGMGIRLQEIKLSFPDNKKLQLVSKVDELNFKFSMTNISPALAQMYTDMVKKSLTGRNQVDNTKMQEYMALQTRLMMEAMQSKTLVRFSIEPLKHYFGEMNIAADLRLYNLMAGPMFTITVNLIDADRILNNIEKANLLPIGIMNSVRRFIDGYGNRNGNGDVTLVYGMNHAEFIKMIVGKNPLSPPKVTEPTGVSR